MESDPTKIKLIVVGDGSVGKTCILLSYTTDKFPTDYVPTIFENYTAIVSMNEKKIQLSLCYYNEIRDTAGQESFNKIRTLTYGAADIFLIVFSVIDQSSFENALKKWYPELSQDQYANVPKIIVGNKIDMRDDLNNKHVRSEAAKQICDKQNIQYFETSALTQEGLKDIFHSAIRIVLQKKVQEQQNSSNDKKQNCQIF